MSHLFPIFLSLEHKRCLVVGGGQVAERKVDNLLGYSAHIEVISPDATKHLQKLAQEKRIVWARRAFSSDDLQGAFLVFAATDNLEVNRQVSELCHQQGLLVNAVDDPEYCDYYIPSTIRRNSLVVAVSTEGKSPAYAKKLRHQLEEIITPQHGRFVDLLGEQRDLIKKSVPDIQKRQSIFEALAKLDILELMECGEEDKARERVQECMSLWLD